MANQLLQSLDRDVERLLMAGSATAVGDDALAQRKGEIEALAARVPALAPVAARLGKVVGATPREGGGELLTLATQNLRLKAAQLEVASVQGEWVALPVTQPVETPLGSFEVKVLREYVIAFNRDRCKFKADREFRGVYRAAVARGDVLDLRLLECLTHNITAEPDVVFRFGAAALPILQHCLDDRLSPSAIDVKAVQFLITTMVKLDAVVARPWVERCLASTNEEVKRQGVLLLPEVAPGEAEARAIALLADASSPRQVCEACLYVLSLGSGVEGLDAMIQAAQRPALKRFAPRYVRNSKHPERAAHLVEALKAAAAPTATFVPFPPGKSCTSKKDREQRKANTLARKHAPAVVSLIEAVPRPLPAELLVVVESLSSHPIEQIRDAAVEALAEGRAAARASEVAGRAPGQTEGHGAGGAEVGGAGGVTASEMGVDRGGA